MYAVPYILQSINPAQLKGIQSGEVQLNSGNTSVTPAIAAVTMNKAFLLFSYKSDSGTDDPDRNYVRGKINTTTQLIFQRQNGTDNVTIQWYVVEFTATSGVNVQRGSHVMAGTTQDIGISWVPLNNAFPVISIDSAYNFYSSSNYISAEITTNTNLRLKVFSIGSVQNVEWQIIYNPQWSVTKYTDTLTGVTNDTTIAAVTLSNAMLISSAECSSPWAYSYGDRIPRVKFTSTTNIRAERASSASPAMIFNFVYYVVTSRKFAIQHHEYSILNTANNAIQALAPNITIANSFLLMTAANVCCATNNGSTSRNFERLLTKHNINAPNQIQAQRGGVIDDIEFCVSACDFSNV